MQWRGSILAVAGSKGLVEFFRLDTNGVGFHLAKLGSRPVADSQILVLSFAWQPERKSSFGVSLSDGKVCLCSSDAGDVWDESTPLATVEIHHHELEAWTVAFSSHGQTTVYSGGDDSALLCSRQSDERHEFTMLWRDRKLHTAGVTAIVPLTHELVVTGSYDDHVRLVATPAVGRRRLLAECNLGGGVWRLKTLHMPSDADGTSQERLNRYDGPGECCVPYPNSGTLIRRVDSFSIVSSFLRAACTLGRASFG